MRILQFGTKRRERSSSPESASASRSSLLRTLKLAGHETLGLARLPVGAALAVFLPQRYWFSVAGALASLRLGFIASDRQTRFEEQLVPSFLTRLANTTPQGILRARRTDFYIECMHILRANFFPNAKPEIALEGIEHVQSALADGKGVILWVTVSDANSLVTKIAFHDAGLRVGHLSRPEHGFNGARLTSGIWQRIENRYLRERFVLRHGNTVHIMRSMVESLEKNGVLSITVGTAASQTAPLPLFGGVIPVATGPAHLALSTGAALLPVISVREGTRYRVTISPPLPVPEANSRSDGIAAIARAYGAVLEPQIEAHPKTWGTWMMPPRSPWRAGTTPSD